MNFAEYQHEATKTSKFKTGGPNAVISPMLGLASETGSILNVYKKYLRDSIDLAESLKFLKEELGDLLWYLATVATHLNLDLEDIATSNLTRTNNLYLPEDKQPATLPNFDQGFPVEESFPRKISFSFWETASDGRTFAHIKVISADPYPFTNVLEVMESKCPGYPIEEPIGYPIEERIGDPLTDNSWIPDYYRYHDAIHISFMTVLGWSPQMRDMLRLKRKSKKETDENEDGQRAFFAEEALAAALSQLAKHRQQFLEEGTVSGEVLNVVTAIVSNLEVKVLPGWLWRKAIYEGFKMMRQLGDNKGGLLVSDLDNREIEYKKY